MQVRTFHSAWDAFSDTPEEAAVMTFKSDLMIDITEFIKKKHWRKTKAAQKCGITVTRLERLLEGKVSEFSIESLFYIMTSLGRNIEYIFHDN